MNSNLFTMRNKFLVILLPLFILSFTILALISYYITQNILVTSADVTASKNRRKIRCGNPHRNEQSPDSPGRISCKPGTSSR